MIVLAEARLLEVGTGELVLMIVGVFLTLALGGLFAFLLLRNDDPGSSRDGDGPDDADR